MQQVRNKYPGNTSKVRSTLLSYPYCRIINGNRYILLLLLLPSYLFLSARRRKAPSYPLITHAPYFSIRSNSDTLTAISTQHWTGADQSLIGLIKVDGTVYRFLGKPEKTYQTVVPASGENNIKLMSYPEIG